MKHRLRSIYICGVVAALIVALCRQPSWAGPPAQAGPYRVEVTTEPAVIPVGKARLLIKVSDAQGKAVAGAQVSALAQMPGMPMGEREEPAIAQSRQPGLYVAPANFAMAGAYIATIKIAGPHGRGEGTLELQTGQNTATQTGGSPGRYLYWIVALGLLAFVVWRMKQTGQRIRPGGLFTRPMLGGIAILLIMLVGVVYAVRHWRRPGALTPLEAQGMEMNMPAPPGTTAVELATVQRRMVQNRVRYSGQAVGYIEQDVYPRVAGNLLWMPFYTGDRVRRGQLLARLDTSQIEPQVAQQRAAAAMARQNTITAQGQYRQALSGISRAQAEVAAKQGELAEVLSSARKAQAEVGSKLGQLAEARSGEQRASAMASGRSSGVTEARSAERRARAALAESRIELHHSHAMDQEARSNLDATREDKNNAEADLSSAQTQVTEVQAQVQAAQADQDYWAPEIERMRVLLKEGAVSREEFQREQAQADSAAAKLRQAQARVEQMQAQVRGAQSRIRRADALINAAEAKAEQAQETIEAYQQRAEGAEADLAGATARVQQATAEVAGAGADVAGASARIRQMAADVRAARAEAAAADARVQRVRAEIEAAASGVRGAQAQAEAARGSMGQAQAGVQQASAAVAAATTLRGYTEIHALVDGVVTQRRISPGTLVQPGQGILQVAQISPIRLQANVAEADLKLVRVGSVVTVRDESGPGKGATLTARVTSVAPAVDPQTRTGLVEAIVPNTDARFLPGEFVSMEIEIGQSRSNLAVPSAAIMRRADDTGSILATQTQTTVWVAEPVPGQANQYTVQQVTVQTGVSDGTMTEIVSGLQEGQRVVVIGYQNLKNGDTVNTANIFMASAEKTSAPATPPLAATLPSTHHEHSVRSESSGPASSQSATVTLTEDGYHPDSLALRAGVPARITFLRKTDVTCGTEIVLPEYHIQKPLPLNQPVVIEFTPRQGEMTFTCGMRMLKGKVVAQ
jgi:RND family efflux transporter MFP subunit